MKYERVRNVTDYLFIGKFEVIENWCSIINSLLYMYKRILKQIIFCIFFLKLNLTTHFKKHCSGEPLLENIMSVNLICTEGPVLILHLRAILANSTLRNLMVGWNSDCIGFKG